MANISFRKTRKGVEFGVWPGVTIQTEKGPRKEGQSYLGKVIDREKLYFWNRKDGYFAFDPETQKRTSLTEAEIPPSYVEPDGSRRRHPIIVDFGDSYFVETLLNDIGYKSVIDSIEYQNRDTLYSLILFYILEDASNQNAHIWYLHNFASYIYPHANIYSQRISDLLTTIGQDFQRRNFLIKHIEYVLSSTDEDVSIIIDSTGLPNACDIPITRVSKHEGEINIEFRMIALVQKSTGFPLFYKIVEGNIVDINTISYIIKIAKKYHCNVSYAIGDAGYCCPSSMEKLILSGIEFMTRMNPTYDIFKQAFTKYGHELNNTNNSVRFNDRIIRIFKIKTKIAIDKTTNEEIYGYLYLCKDLQSSANKLDNFMSSSLIKNMTTEEIEQQCAKFGIFAIVTTRDIEPNEVLPEYYIRQNVEQYFDFGKNYAKFLPVRQHNMLTLSGHMLIAFIASFITILIKNRLNIIDSKYIELPKKIFDSEECTDIDYYICEDKVNGIKYIYADDPILSVFKESPSTLFYELRGHKAEIFDDEIIPSIPIKQAKDFYSAFKLNSPETILRDNEKIEYVYNPDEKNNLDKTIAFSRRPSISDKAIEEKRKRGDLKKIEKLAKKSNVTVKINKNEETVTNKECEIKKKRGRPKGVRNKKTILREQEEKRLGIKKEKKKPGRPKGRKNKKNTYQVSFAYLIINK